jgi:RHS repeat-associated protein
VKSVATGLTALFNADTNIQSLDLTSTNLVAATLNTSETFSANPILAAPQNNAAVSAVDGGNNTKTNSYQIAAKGALAQNLSYDLNGNLLSDGSNTYQWDAENCLIQINYPGSNNYSQLVYDGNNECVRIVETSAGSIIGTKQFVRCSGQMSESRDGSSNLVSQFFSLGQTISGTNYYYVLDHMGSVREVRDTSGNLQATYNYDLFGRVSQSTALASSDFQFAAYFFHARSGLNLTQNRAYSPVLGRWLSRDPLDQPNAVNLYGYVRNNPVSRIDPSGLADIEITPGVNGSWIPGMFGIPVWYPYGNGSAGRRHIYEDHIRVTVRKPKAGKFRSDALPDLPTIISTGLHHPDSIECQPEHHFKITSHVGYYHYVNGFQIGPPGPVGWDSNNNPTYEIIIILYYMDNGTLVVLSAYPAG